MTARENYLGASLADASSLLLGIDRKLSKIESEPQALPPANPLPAQYAGLGDVTRVKRMVQFQDGGRSLSDERFESEWRPIQGTVCDPRDTVGIMGEPSRLQGRAPMILRK
jgi:hypothetical protein